MYILIWAVSKISKRLFLFNIKLLNILVIGLFFVVFIPLFFISFYINDGNINYDIGWVFFVLLILLLFVHELLHGFAFAFFGKVPIRSIKYGYNIKKIIAYCTCDVPVNKNAYFIVAIFPLLITSVIPAFFVLNMGRLDAVLFVSLAFVFSIGDIVMAMEILRLPKKSKIIDCPNDAGFYLIEEQVNFKEVFKPLFSKEIREENKEQIKNTSENSSKTKVLQVAVVSFCCMMVFLLLLYLGVRTLVANYAKEAGREKFKQEQQIEK